MTQFIVGEVSKNWPEESGSLPGLVCTHFENMIEHNRQLGYRLHSFQMNRVMTAPLKMNETIIAVFERMEPERG